MENISDSAALRINSPRVAHQTLDEETIIIDFESGTYFSTNSTGAAIWRQIAQNASVNQIIQALMERYADDSGVIRNGVEQFLLELQRESLIEQADLASFTPDAVVPMLNPNPAAQFAFQPPLLGKYTDMQDLLLLDAIHDVDAQGWPTKKSENAE